MWSIVMRSVVMRSGVMRPVMHLFTVRAKVWLVAILICQKTTKKLNKIGSTLLNSHKSGVFAKKKKKTPTTRLFEISKGPPKNWWNSFRKRWTHVFQKFANPKKNTLLPTWSHDFSYQVTWTTWEPEPADPEEEEDPPQDPLAAAPMPRIFWGVKK